MGVNKVAVLDTKLTIEAFVAENSQYRFDVEDDVLSNHQGSWAFVSWDVEEGKILLTAEAHVPEGMLFELLEKYGGEYYASEYDRKPTRIFEKEGEKYMKYNVSYERNGVSQTLLMKAASEEVAERYFREMYPNAHVYGVKEATMDDERPGKPVVEVPEWYQVECARKAAGEYHSLQEIFERFGLDKHTDPEFRYQLLSRMKGDCDYYLGYGNRHDKYLWAGNARDQITVMKALWEAFPKDGKPEWLTYDQLLKYEGELCGIEVFFTFGSWEKYPFENGYISITAPSVKMAFEEFRRNYPDVNEGCLNCADYYWREESKARIREDGNGAKCHRKIVVESKDLGVDAIVANASSRCGICNKNPSKNDIDLDMV